MTRLITENNFASGGYDFAIMNLFPNNIVVLVFVWLGANSVRAADAILPDALWRKAVAVAAANADWVPGLSITRIEVFRKGESVGVHELWQRSQLGPAGEFETETIKAFENGKPVKLDDKSADKKRGSGKKHSEKSDWNPFAADAQSRLTLKTVAHSRVIAGQDCAGFTFVLPQTNGVVLQGTAWLATPTGVPVTVEDMSIEPLPDKHLQRLALTTHYETTTNGDWRATSIITASTVSVFFFKAEVQTTTTLSDYWKKPSAGNHASNRLEKVPAKN